MRSGPQRVALTFGGRTLELNFAGPHGEFVRPDEDPPPPPPPPPD